MTAKSTSTGVIDWGALTFFLDICECLESCDLLDSCDSVVDSSDSMHGGEGRDRLAVTSLVLVHRCVTFTVCLGFFASCK